MSEFSIVNMRNTQLDSYIEKEDKKAVYAKKIVAQADKYLAACRLGVIMTTIGIGCLTADGFAAIFQSVMEHSPIFTTMTGIFSVILAFLFVVFFYGVFGEMAPKILAIQKPEQVTRWIARPLFWFHRLCYPFLWLMNGAWILLSRAVGLKPIHAAGKSHSEEELRLMMEDSYKNGEINQAEMMYVNNIFEFDERLTKEIIVPRKEMLVFYMQDSIEEHVKIIREGPFTRYPVADGDKDNIIGMVNVKDIFTRQIKNEKLMHLETYIRPIIHVTEAMPIRDLLIKMQKEHIHMAVVHDEYGGTAGLVTVEDILEEIVGDIRDEFDTNELPMIKRLDDATSMMAGKLQLEHVEAELGITMAEEEIDTIGGWFFSNSAEVVKEGSTIRYEGYLFTAAEVDGYQIKKISVRIDNQLKEVN